MAIAAVRTAADVSLLDVHSDPDHNRSVLTLVGGAVAVAEAAFALAMVCAAEIDMTQHRGVHPRMGALDVLPFVPLGSTPMELCVALAHNVGRRLAAELNVPVFFYAEAALRPERRLLANVRRGEYEGLLPRVGADPDAAPDAGPSVLGTAGATAVGARNVLVAFNVRLGTRDVRTAREIARRVRASSGGLPGVQALGLELTTENMVQVSMNVTDLVRTPVHIAYEAVCAAAADLGVAVAESELVGLLPAEAALSAASRHLGLPELTPRQIIDLAVHQDAADGDG